MATKVLPLRLSIGANTTVDALARETHQEVQRALAHRGLMTDELRRLCTTEHGASIYTVSMNIFSYTPELSFGGHSASCEFPATGPVSDLTFNLYARNDSGRRTYELVVEANPDLYSEEDARQHARRLVRVISAVAADPGALVADVGLLDGDEGASIREFG